MFEDVEEIKPAEGDGELHYFYNRKERIAHAPLSVQQYYEKLERGENVGPVRGFKIFFTKQNRFIFFGLIFFVAFAWIYTAINNTRNQTVLDGVVYNLSAFSYEDEVYITIKSKIKESEKTIQELPFSASVFAINSDNQLQEKLTLKGLTENGKEEQIRAKIKDFDIIRIDVIIDSDGKSKELSTFVTR